MSTHSAIAMKVEDYYLAIYCHSDGYVQHNGVILRDHYTDPIKVKKLIDLGDISFLDVEVDIPEGVIHSFEKRAEGITVAYGRDRGEKSTDAIKCISPYDIKLNIDCGNNLYIFENGKWFYNGVAL